MGGTRARPHGVDDLPPLPHVALSATAAAGQVRGDITSPADLDRLLRHFYAESFADELLGHVFVDVVGMDLEDHLPAIAAFWQRVLLGTGEYQGRPLAQHRAVHAQVPLTEEHFARWLALWRASLDAHFTGPITELAYSRAARTAGSFLRNLHATEPPRSLPLLHSRRSGAGSP